jgi:tetratricopeptide (TPR) repeat protein
MYCLLADTYKKKKSDKPDETARFQQLAVEAYKNAAKTKSPDDVIQYALDQVTAMLQANQEWAAIAELHTDFIKNNPNSALTLPSVGWIVKTLARENKIPEATAIVADALKPKIGDASCEQVEFLIDELVKTIVPRKKAVDVDLVALDKQLVEILNKAIAGQENATTNARIYYARARLAQALKRNDLADTYLKSIATINADNPAILSPALLATSGDILLKSGELDKAQAMYQRLIDRYPDGMYADAGPYGLGYIALARKKPADALKIFETALEQNPGQSRTKEMTLGKIEALIDVGRLDDAEKLATETIGDRSFRGEFAGKANLMLARVYRKQSEKATDAIAKLEILKKSQAICQRVYVTYKTSPDVCAEAYLQAYLAATDLGNKTGAAEIITELLANPKLKNTEAYKKAALLPH